MDEQIWLFEHNERFNTGKAIAGYPENPRSEAIKAMKHFLQLMQTTKDTGAVFCAVHRPVGSTKAGDVITDLFAPEPTPGSTSQISDITNAEYNRLAKRYVTADTWLHPHGEG